MSKLKILTMLYVLIFVNLIVGFVASIPVFFLWNALVPDIFDLPQISWLQSWGLVILTGLLFKSSSNS